MCIQLFCGICWIASGNTVSLKCMYCSWFNLQCQLSANNVFPEKVCISCTINCPHSKSVHLITVRYLSHANKIRVFLPLMFLLFVKWLRLLWQAVLPIPVVRKVFILTYGEKKAHQKVIFSIECTTTHWWGNEPRPCAFTHCCQPRVSYPTCSKNTTFLILQSVKQDTEALTSRASGRALYAKG